VFTIQGTCIVDLDNRTGLKIKSNTLTKFLLHLVL
jgi:hypothetical protein